jgi:hypothetical protein
MSLPRNISEKLRWVLLGCLLATAGWIYWSEAMSPLLYQEQANRHRMAEASLKLKSERAAVHEIRLLEERVAETRTELDRWKHERPADSAMFWFPEQIQKHFRQFGVATPVTRLNTAKEEPGMPRFERSYWAVDVTMGRGSRECTKMLLAVAELEKQNPHTRVIDFAIWEDPEAPSQSRVVINLSTLARR